VTRIIFAVYQASMSTFIANDNDDLANPTRNVVTASPFVPDSLS
jgi:hypothetical protein